MGRHKGFKMSEKHKNNIREAQKKRYANMKMKETNYKTPFIKRIIPSFIALISDRI